jgi:hypothetical protein
MDTTHLHASNHTTLERVPALLEEVHDGTPSERSVDLEQLGVGRARLGVGSTGRRCECAPRRTSQTAGSDGCGGDRRSSSREERRDDSRDDVQHDLETSCQSQSRYYHQERVRTCSLTALRSPKTNQPPTKPAKNVSALRSLPPASVFWSKSAVL